MLNTSTTIRVETFRVPSWRFDIAREEDLVEEVARHYGYDKIESLLPAAHSAGFYHPSEEAKRGIRACLSILGFDEAVNFSFIPVKLSQNVELLPAVEHQRRGAAVILRNPIIEGADLMRPSLIPGLLATVRHNLNQGNRNLQIFEMGRVFFESVRKGELPAERESLGLVVTGEAQMEGTIASDRLLDFFDLKGAIEACSDEARFEPVRFAPTDVKHLRTGQSAGLYSGSNLIGYAGRLNEEISQSLKFRHPVYVAELDLTSLLENRTGLVRYSPLPRFPLVHRDLSVIVDRKVSLSNIIETIQTNAVELLTAVDFVRVFEGGNILPGKKSVTVRLTYRADDRTLRDDEVEQIQNAVVFSLNERLGGEVRV